MAFLEILLPLLGLFYLVVLPILVFVALGRPSQLSHRIQRLEFELAELRAKFNQSSAKSTEGKMAAPTTAAMAEPSVKPPIPTPPINAGAKAPEVTSTPPATIAIPRSVTPPPLIGSTAAPVAHATKTTPAVSSPVEKKSDISAEITLGARWATRLGIGFLVVAVVFFGVYITQYSTPLIRLLEVVAVAAGITGFGFWLERQAREFGEAVFAGGLAMFYFAAFAAHVIHPMQVIPDAQIGLGLTVQYLAIALVAGVAWWRNRPHLCTMAIALGMVTCFFALHRDQLEISLGASLGLMMVAALLRVARGWTWPVMVGYVGAQICYVGSVLVTMGFTVEHFFSTGMLYTTAARMNAALGLWPGCTLIFPAVYFILQVGADNWAQSRGQTTSSPVRTSTILTSTILYGTGSWWGGAMMGNSWASDNLLAAAIICLITGMMYHRRRDAREIYEILYASAGVWTAFYFINEYAGWIRWLALMMEAFIFAWRARRHGSPYAWACVFGAWAGSAGMAFHDTTQIANGTLAWDSVRLKFLLWPLVSVALWSWIEKTSRTLQKNERGMVDLGGALTAAASAVFGVTAWINPAQPWAFLTLALVLAAMGLLIRVKAVWPTAAISLLLSMWIYAPAADASTGEVIALLAALSVVVMATTGIIQTRLGDTLKNLATGAEYLGFLSLLYAWMRGLLALKNGESHVPLSLLLSSLVLAALTWRGPWRRTADLAWAWAATALVTSLLMNAEAATSTLRLCLALVVLLGWFNGYLAQQEPRKVFLLHPQQAGLIIPGILFAGWTVLALPQGNSPLLRMQVLAGFAVIYAVVGRREWLPGGGLAAVLLSIGAGVEVFNTDLHTSRDVFAPAVVAIAVLLQSWLMVRRFPEWPRAPRDIFLLIIAAAALFVFDWSAHTLPPPPHQFLTLFWAAAGAVLFIVGLAARLRSYRYVSLAGLALCVPRIFFVDITDQFQRILAFGGLALVLLAIGFSYHKLRLWLVALDGKEAKTPPKPAA